MSESPPSPRLKPLEAAEWLVSVLLTGTVVTLLIIRANCAGGLWRDECATVQVALVPNVSEIFGLFEHTAHPPPFFLLIRAYSDVFGTSDLAYRMFGLGVGLLLVGSLWWSARLLGHGVPLLALTLIGLNSTVLQWGTTVRAYGLGSVLILVTLTLIVQVLRTPTWPWIAAAAAAALAGVQCTLYNSVLLLAIGGAAIVVAVCSQKFRAAAAIAGVGLLSAASILPYVASYRSGSEWNMLVKREIDFRWLLQMLCKAVGAPSTHLVWVWLGLLIVCLVGGTARWRRLRSADRQSQREALSFGVLAVIASAVCYWGFLTLLSYPTQTWYYITLMVAVAAAMDLIVQNLCDLTWVRWARLGLAATAVATIPIAAGADMLERQTNVDVIAKALNAQAAEGDLIVVSPWHIGLTFNWYYHGKAEWMTLPPISDMRTSRFDLAKVRLMEDQPIRDLLDGAERTLKSGHRLWLVGGVHFFPDPEYPAWLPPAPNSRYGWDEWAYLNAWSQQLGQLHQIAYGGARGGAAASGQIASGRHRIRSLFRVQRLAGVPTRPCLQQPSECPQGDALSGCERRTSIRRSGTHKARASHAEGSRRRPTKRPKSGNRPLVSCGSTQTSLS